MRSHTLLVLTIALLGCSASGSAPDQIAEEFWLASKEGDVERARELVLSTSSAKINDSKGGESQIGDFSLGASHIEDDEATVETTISGLPGLEQELSFNTVLAREDGAWKIDLDGTTADMTKAIFGTSMQDMAQQMGQAMGEAMGEAMEGMAEGMAEGMRSLGDSLAATSDRAGDRR